MNQFWIALAGVVLSLSLGCVSGGPGGAASAGDGPVLYTKEGTDPTFEELKEKKAFPIGKNSVGGVTGSPDGVVLAAVSPTGSVADGLGVPSQLYADWPGSTEV
jgi:hypothetical protein